MKKVEHRSQFLSDFGKHQISVKIIPEYHFKRSYLYKLTEPLVFNQTFFMLKFPKENDSSYNVSLDLLCVLLYCI